MYTKYVITYVFGNWMQVVEECETLIQADNNRSNLIRLGGIPERLKIELRYYNEFYHNYYTKQIM